MQIFAKTKNVAWIAAADYFHFCKLKQLFSHSQGADIFVGTAAASHLVQTF